MRDSSKNVLFLFNSYNTWNKYKSAGIKYLDFTDRFVLKYFWGSKIYVVVLFIRERYENGISCILLCGVRKKGVFTLLNIATQARVIKGCFVWVPNQF